MSGAFQLLVSAARRRGMAPWLTAAKTAKEEPMWRLRLLTGLGALAAGAALAGAATASAANGPAYRDCAFALGVDPDFVQLLGATVGPGGALTVLPAQRFVQLEGSESSDPGDSAGQV